MPLCCRSQLPLCAITRMFYKVSSWSWVWTSGPLVWNLWFGMFQSWVLNLCFGISGLGLLVFDLWLMMFGLIYLVMDCWLCDPCPGISCLGSWVMISGLWSWALCGCNHPCLGTVAWLAEVGWLGLAGMAAWLEDGELVPEAGKLAANTRETLGLGHITGPLRKKPRKDPLCKPS